MSWRCPEALASMLARYAKQATEKRDGKKGKGK